MMKNIIAAAAFSLLGTAAISEAPNFVTSDEVSHPSLCFNALNPVTGEYFRQEEADVKQMMDYLQKSGFTKADKVRGPCQTTFSVVNDDAYIRFIFSTLTGDFVGIDTIKYSPDFQMPKVDGIHL